MRIANDSDAPQLQDVWRAAFAPVFASFRAILGEEISEVTQARDDQAQAEYLASLLLPRGCRWRGSAACLDCGAASSPLCLDEARVRRQELDESMTSRCTDRRRDVIPAFLSATPTQLTSY
jgi:hypothetical protein